MKDCHLSLTLQGLTGFIILLMMVELHGRENIGQEIPILLPLSPTRQSFLGILVGKSISHLMEAPRFGTQKEIRGVFIRNLHCARLIPKNPSLSVYRKWR